MSNIERAAERMKQIFHDDFLGEDIPRILEESGDSAFKEFSKCLDKTFVEIENNPPNGAPLERSLALYRKKKFHSVLSGINSCPICRSKLDIPSFA